MIEYLPVLVSILLLLLIIPTFATLADSRRRRTATRVGYTALFFALVVLVVVALLSGEGVKEFLYRWSLPMLLFVWFIANVFGTPGLRQRDTGRRRH
jgi:small neutral amino acid transporter SnatA (MarC family)